MKIDTIAIVCCELHKHFIMNNNKKYYDKIIGVEKGSVSLLRKGIKNQYAVGDFDSISTNELEEIKRNVIKIFQYPKEKNKTDLELAIDLCNKNNKIDIFIPTGKRIDHLLSQIIILIRTKNKNITIYDNYNKIYHIQSGIHKILYHKEFKYISFYTIKENICSITNTKYTVNKLKLNPYSILMTSNEQLKNKSTIIKCSQKLIVCHSKE